MGREGFEPPKAKLTDLQSAVFDHSTICPFGAEILADPKKNASDKMGSFCVSPQKNKCLLFPIRKIYVYSALGTFHVKSRLRERLFWWAFA